MKYKCPDCNKYSTAEDWNANTEDYFNDDEGDIAEIDGDDPSHSWFVCPNCSQINLYESIVQD